MLSSSDAKITEVEMYDVEDMPVEDLRWAFTSEEDFAYRGEFELEFSDNFMEYWQEESGKWFWSTRSTWARNAVHFWIDEDWHVDDEGMEGSFEGRSFRNPIEFEEGDDIFRILAYAEDDRLTNSEVSRRADEIVPGGEYKIDENILKIPIDRRLTLDRVTPDKDLLEDQKDKYINRGPTEFEVEGNLRSFELLETVPISMPDDLYGIIRGTSIEGHTYHLDSVAIDPGYDERVATEVPATKRKQPEIPPSWEGKLYLEVELYESTEPEYLTQNTTPADPRVA